MILRKHWNNIKKKNNMKKIVKDIKVYKNGKWESLIGQRIFYNGKWVKIKSGFGINYNGMWMVLG